MEFSSKHIQILLVVPNEPAGMDTPARLRMETIATVAGLTTAFDEDDRDQRVLADAVEKLHFHPLAVQITGKIEQVDFEQLLSVSDYISVHCPLTPETKGLFGESAFKKMKKKAYLVNTARGPVVDEAALAKALDAGEIAGAGLDVMTNEPPVGSPLLGNKKVIITPHTSFYSEESLVDLQTKAAQEVANVLTGKPERNPVNQVAK